MNKTRSQLFHIKENSSEATKIGCKGHSKIKWENEVNTISSKHEGASGKSSQSALLHGNSK